MDEVLEAHMDLVALLKITSIMEYPPRKGNGLRQYLASP
jgi:hypothetical protein